jgi:hypothetical protein
MGPIESKNLKRGCTAIANPMKAAMEKIRGSHRRYDGGQNRGSETDQKGVRRTSRIHGCLRVGTVGRAAPWQPGPVNLPLTITPTRYDDVKALRRVRGRQLGVPRVYWA